MSTTGRAQDTPCTPHAKSRLARAKRILWVRHIASNISLEDREGHASILDLARAMRVPNRAYCFLVNGDVAVFQKNGVGIALRTIQVIILVGTSAVRTGESPIATPKEVSLRRVTRNCAVTCVCGPLGVDANLNQGFKMETRRIHPAAPDAGKRPTVKTPAVKGRRKVPTDG